MEDRLSQFGAMLSAVQREYADTVSKLEALKAADKTKTATYRKSLGDKLTLNAILTRYRVYGLLGGTINEA